MKHFTAAEDVESVPALVDLALDLKHGRTSPWSFKGKSIVLVFFNPSMRTRLSTEKAGRMLGMDVSCFNIGEDGWALETEEGAVMDAGKPEHIKDFARVLGRYADVVGIRSFAGLKDWDTDSAELVSTVFKAESGLPVLSLESTMLHPLQSLADLITLREHARAGAKVVLRWAPHPKPLPHAVANSFLSWARAAGYDLQLNCPKGYELNPSFLGDTPVNHDPEAGLEGAEVVYAKSWCSSQDYGKHLDVAGNWMVRESSLGSNPRAQFMHCMPIRRNVIATDAVIDHSLIYEQAENRVHAAVAALHHLLTPLP